MKRTSKTRFILVLSLLSAALYLSWVPVNGAEAPRMSKEELRSLLGNPDVVILDVRVEPEWRESKDKIQGAIREEPREVNKWADKYPKSKTLVLYCS